MTSLLTTREAAAMLCVDASTVRALTRAGRLPVVQVTPGPKGRRYHPADLETYIRENTRCRGIVATSGTPTSRSTADALGNLLAAPARKPSARRPRSDSNIVPFRSTD